MATNLAFFIFGLLPLLSFLIPHIATYNFLVSSVLTAVSLFLVGSLRVVVSRKHWLRGGLEMLLIGGCAALIAYYVGFWVERLV